MRLLRAMSIFPVFCVLLLTGAFSVAAAAPPTEAACRDIFVAAGQQMVRMKSCHAIFESTASTTTYGKKTTFVFSGEGDYQAKPVLLRNAVKITMDFAGKKNEFTLLQYAEEAKDKLVAYTLVENRWTKMLVPAVNAGGYAAFYDQIIKEMRIAFVRETDDALVLEAAISADTLRKEILEELAAAGLREKLPAFPLEDLEDLKYTVVVDKKTKLVSSFSVDLSNLFQTVWPVLIEALQDSDKRKTAWMGKVFENTELKVKCAFSRVNAIDAIIIPSEARNAPFSASNPAAR